MLWRYSPATGSRRRRRKIEFDGANLAGVTAELSRTICRRANGSGARPRRPRASSRARRFSQTHRVAGQAHDGGCDRRGGQFVRPAGEPTHGTAGKNWEEPKFRNLAKRFKQGETSSRSRPRTRVAEKIPPGFGWVSGFSLRTVDDGRRLRQVVEGQHRRFRWLEQAGVRRHHMAFGLGAGRGDMAPWAWPSE